MDISMDKAKALLDRGIAEAQELIKNPDGIDGLLVQLENKLKEVPAIGDTLSDLRIQCRVTESDRCPGRRRYLSGKEERYYSG